MRGVCEALSQKMILKNLCIHLSLGFIKHSTDALSFTIRLNVNILDPADPRSDRRPSQCTSDCHESVRGLSNFISEATGHP